MIFHNQTTLEEMIKEKKKKS